MLRTCETKASERKREAARLPYYPLVISDGGFNAYTLMRIPDNDDPVPPPCLMAPRIERRRCERLLLPGERVCFREPPLGSWAPQCPQRRRQSFATGKSFPLGAESHLAMG